MTAQKTDAELDRKIAQSEGLAQLLILKFDRLPAAIVMHALAMVIAYAVEKQSADKNLDATMKLLAKAAVVELEIMRAARKSGEG